MMADDGRLQRRLDGRRVKWRSCDPRFGEIASTACGGDVPSLALN